MQRKMRSIHWIDIDIIKTVLNIFLILHLAMDKRNKFSVIVYFIDSIYQYG